MAAPEPVISVRDVSKTYCGLRHASRSLKSTVVGRLKGQRRELDEPALRGISMEVTPGEAVGIIGPNGSGKTTLLGIMSNVIVPTEGAVVTRGRICVLLEAAVGFHPDLTGVENAILQGMILGMSRRDVVARLDDIIEFADASAYIEHPVRTYSLGQRARLGFSVAAHLEPDVLLVDEVLAVADEEFHRVCYTKIRELRQAGCAIVFVTHVMDQVREVCDRVILIEDGLITKEGPADEVIDHYERMTAQHLSGR